jgi:hypothetical protein
MRGGLWTFVVISFNRDELEHTIRQFTCFVVLVQCTGNIMDISYVFCAVSPATELPSMYMNILTALACFIRQLSWFWSWICAFIVHYWTAGAYLTAKWHLRRNPYCWHLNIAGTVSVVPMFCAAVIVLWLYSGMIITAFFFLHANHWVLQWRWYWMP